MPIDATERRLMMQAKSIGERMIDYLEEIGIESLAELKTANAEELAFRINIALGRRHINRMGVRALENLIAHAKASDC